MEVYQAPIKWKMTALEYESILEEVRPALENIAKQRAKTKMKEEEFKQRRG